MYPDWEKIKEGMKSGINMRVEELRDSCFLGCLDIYYKEVDNYALYSANQIGKGMLNTIARAANIRKVLPYGTAPIFFEELLQTMNVTFVRNGQLTIMPFPFKYLREYIDIKLEKKK
jgi:hypothetical protein